MPRRTEIDPAIEVTNIPVRSTVQMCGKSYAQVFRMTRDYSLTVGEVIDVLLEIANRDSATTKLLMEQARREKVSSRRARKTLAHALFGATPEQLRMLDVIMRTNK